MKKNLTFLTGIVCAIAILVAGACGSAPENDPQTFTDLTDRTDLAIQAVPEEVDTVIISLVEAFEENGTKHLNMFDSHNPGIIVKDNLETFVWPGTVVIWVALDGSGIQKLKKISPKDDSNGNIMHRDAKGFFYTLFTGKKKHKVPDNQTPGEIEEYLIKFKHEDNSIWEIDPYLKIPEE